MVIKVIMIMRNCMRGEGDRWSWVAN